MKKHFDIEGISDAKLSYAGFWKRFAAFIIDMFLLSVANFLLGFIFSIPYDVLIGKAEFVSFSGDYFLSSILSILIAWVYVAAMESSAKQATVGKMVLGLIVTDLSGSPISFGRATGRHFAKIISWLTLGVGFIMIAFTKRKQGLHDVVAKCLVLNKH